MEKIGYTQFQQEIGAIIITWSRAEERFRDLLGHVAGLERDAGQIVFNAVSAVNQRRMLLQLGALRYSEAAQDDLAHCVRLHETNAANRNLFAHGHIGFASLDNMHPFAMRSKPHVGKTGVTTKAWNVQWREIVKIVPAIEAFDSYVGLLIGNLQNDLDTETAYMHGPRPDMPTDCSAGSFDLARAFNDRN
jgi:hypothetical protein